MQCLSNTGENCTALVQYSDFRLASYLVTLTDMEKGLTCDRELKAYISQHTQASQTVSEWLFLSRNR